MTIGAGFCMGEVTSVFKLAYVEHKHFIYIVSLSRCYYNPHFTDGEGKAQSLRPDRGCQNLSNSFNPLWTSCIVCYVRPDSPLTPEPTQPISASLPFHPSQDLVTFPGLFQIVPSLTPLPFLSSPLCSPLPLNSCGTWGCTRVRPSGITSRLCCVALNKLVNISESLKKWAVSLWCFWMIS